VRFFLHRRYFIKRRRAHFFLYLGSFIHGTTQPNDFFLFDNNIRLRMTGRFYNELSKVKKKCGTVKKFLHFFIVSVKSLLAFTYKLSIVNVYIVHSFLDENLTCRDPSRHFFSQSRRLLTKNCEVFGKLEMQML
jgi:hypothetical protein